MSEKPPPPIHHNNEILRATMHNAAERARVRRQQEEEEREKNKERARKKAEELAAWMEAQKAEASAPQTPPAPTPEITGGPHPPSSERKAEPPWPRDQCPLTINPPKDPERKEERREERKGDTTRFEEMWRLQGEIGDLKGLVEKQKAEISKLKEEREEARERDTTRSREAWRLQRENGDLKGLVEKQKAEILYRHDQPGGHRSPQILPPPKIICHHQNCRLPNCVSFVTTKSAATTKFLSPAKFSSPLKFPCLSRGTSPRLTKRPISEGSGSQQQKSPASLPSQPQELPAAPAVTAKFAGNPGSHRSPRNLPGACHHFRQFPLPGWSWPYSSRRNRFHHSLRHFLLVNDPSASSETAG